MQEAIENGLLNLIVIPIFKFGRSLLITLYRIMGTQNNLSVDQTNPY